VGGSALLVASTNGMACEGGRVFEGEFTNVFGASAEPDRF